MEDLVSEKKIRDSQTQYYYMYLNKDVSKDINDFELKTLEDYSYCDEMQYIKNKYNLDNKELMQQISDKFYNPNIMSSSKCVIETFVSNGSLQEKVRNWINNLVYINEGEFGYVLYAKVDSSAFIVKVAKDNESLLHEYFIGINGLNKLREYVPNFMYTFGYWKCSSLIKSDENDYEYENEYGFGNEVYTWCTKDGPSQYLILENISPSKTFADIFSKLSNNDESLELCLNSIMQILYALNKANELIDFTHYDMHMNNVMIRDVGNISIKYETERGIEYLNTSFVATIIDYGYSHMKYEGKDVGFIVDDNESNLRKFSKSGIYPDKSNPLTDAHKLLLSMYKYAKHYRLSKIMSCVDTIYRFFNKEGVKTTTYYEQYYYSMPIPFKPITLLDLAKYIRNEITIKFITTKPLYKSINCKDIKCDSSEEFIDNVFNGKEQDIFSFYSSRSEATDRFRYKESFDNAKKKLDKLLLNINMKYIENSFIKYPDDVRKSVSMLTYSRLDFEKKIKEMIKIYDTLFLVDSLLKAMDYVSNLYNYNIDYLEEKYNEIDNIKDIFQQRINEIKEIRKYENILSVDTRNMLKDIYGLVTSNI